MKYYIFREDFENIKNGSIIQEIFEKLSGFQVNISIDSYPNVINNTAYYIVELFMLLYGQRQIEIIKDNITEVTSLWEKTVYSEILQLVRKINYQGQNGENSLIQEQLQMMQFIILINTFIKPINYAMRKNNNQQNVKIQVLSKLLQLTENKNLLLNQLTENSYDFINNLLNKTWPNSNLKQPLLEYMSKAFPSGLGNQKLQNIANELMKIIMSQ